METRDLEEILKKASVLEKDRVLSNIQEISFVDYINQLMIDKNLEKSDIIRDSQIPRTYAYQGYDLMQTNELLDEFHHELLGDFN